MPLTGTERVVARTHHIIMSKCIRLLLIIVDTVCKLPTSCRSLSALLTADQLNWLATYGPTACCCLVSYTPPEMPVPEKQAAKRHQGNLGCIRDD